MNDDTSFSFLALFSATLAPFGPFSPFGTRKTTPLFISFSMQHATLSDHILPRSKILLL
ncbi:hypothetical protein K445DRAFT_321616 [Daldinia sp. EC12]|nr:hypothetical protein K445DRAFT_321616 [Daldinia sp. EC12]